MTFLFATGMDNACPTVPGGGRLDQMDRCGHYARWEEDLALVREMGIGALRYGPAYYRTHQAPDWFEWESCDEPLQRLRESGTEVIADLCRFGVPNWLGGFQDPAFPVLFAEYARAFARRYPWIRYFAPISEILTCATYSALHGRWNECQKSEGSFVRALRNMCMAHELAVDAICSERPDAIIIQTESLRRPQANATEPLPQSERLEQLRFLVFDLTLGSELSHGVAGLLHDHGVTSNELTFFRERRWHRRRALAITQCDGAGAPMTADGALQHAAEPADQVRGAAECHGRYSLPLLICLTHYGNSHTPGSMPDRFDVVRTLAARRIPVIGFAWHSLVDIVGWENGTSARNSRIHPAGLADLSRKTRPVGEAFGKLARQWRAGPDRSITPTPQSLDESA